MFQDRIEVISPGGLYGIVTVDNIGTYGTSSSRNQYLSRILESAPYPAEYPERGYVVENKGTGYAQIQASLKSQGMPPAKPVDSLSVFVLTMRKSEKTATTNTAMPEVGPMSKTSSKLSSDAGQTLINAVQENGSISKTEASELLGTSGATAYRRIKELIDAGALVVAGKQGRSTRYKLAN
jgi:ATP-dependent DNA helicase RecG